MSNQGLRAPLGSGMVQTPALTEMSAYSSAQLGSSLSLTPASLGIVTQDVIHPSEILEAPPSGDQVAVWNAYQPQPTYGRHYHLNLKWSARPVALRQTPSPWMGLWEGMQRFCYIDSPELSFAGMSASEIFPPSQESPAWERIQYLMKSHSWTGQKKPAPQSGRLPDRVESSSIQSIKDQERVSRLRHLAELIAIGSVGVGLVLWSVYLWPLSLIATGVHYFWNRRYNAMQNRLGEIDDIFSHALNNSVIENRDRDFHWKGQVVDLDRTRELRFKLTQPDVSITVSEFKVYYQNLTLLPPDHPELRRGFKALAEGVFIFAFREYSTTDEANLPRGLATFEAQYILRYLITLSLSYNTRLEKPLRQAILEFLDLSYVAEMAEKNSILRYGIESIANEWGDLD